MRNTIRRTMCLGAATAAVLAGGLLSAVPAEAGGSSTGSVEAPSNGLCVGRLTAAIVRAQSKGWDVYNTSGCFRSSGSTTWHGYYSYER